MTRAVAATLALLLLAVPTLPIHAVEPKEMLADPALESRAREIGRALRCVVCQNQSIDDSNAEVAGDMRRAVRERLTAGDSDAAVFDFMVARYGDYVLLKPPFKARTLLLWLGTPLVLLIAAAALFLASRRRPAPVAPPPLSDEERKRLDALLRHAPDCDAVAPTVVIPSEARDLSSRPKGPSPSARDDNRA